LQHAFKQLVDLFFADLVRSEKLFQVEIRESTTGYSSRQERAQAAGINRRYLANFLEDHALQRIVKDTGIEQLADLDPRAALDQDRAEKAQRVFLKVKSGVQIMKRHVVFLHSTVNEMIPE